MLQLTSSKLEKSKELADEELCKIVDEKRQLITYNHYYTDNIQSARQDSWKRTFEKAMRSVVEEDWKGKFHISNTPIEFEKLIVSL